MADVKISALAALAGADTATDDLYVVVDTSAVETKKQTRAELFKSIPAADFAEPAVFNEAGADKDYRFEGDTDPNLLFTDASTDRVGVGTNAPTTKLQVSGSFGLNAPTVVTTAYSVSATDNCIISARTASNTLTLPTPASNTGRVLWIAGRTNFTVVSASSNVVPRLGGTPSTAILPASATGAWAFLWCDGTNWIIIAAGV